MYIKQTMRKTRGGIVAIVASLWTGCSTAPTDSRVRSAPPAHIGFGNFLGSGCPIYGNGMYTYRPYDLKLTTSDIWLTEGNPLRVLKLSTDRILAQKRLRYPIEETSNARENARNDVERQLLVFNPQFYVDYHHQFEAGETIYYPSYLGNEIGGTLNCTL